MRHTCVSLKLHTVEWVRKIYVVHKSLKQWIQRNACISERAFLIFSYGQYLAWKSQKKSTHSQMYIDLFAQQTLQWRILLNLLYISKHLVNTIVRTFGSVQKETRFQPNEIAFCYLCFRNWVKYCSRTLQVMKSRCFCLVEVTKVLSTLNRRKSVSNKHSVIIHIPLNFHTKNLYPLSLFLLSNEVIKFWWIWKFLKPFHCPRPPSKK